MSPYEQIEAKYAAHPQEQPFGFYVQWHLRFGFVFSTPEFFIMGRGVNRSAVESWGVYLEKTPALESYHPHDAWYIHAMAGDMTRAWDILPYPLPWLAWERILDGKRDLRFYSAAEVKRLCTITHAA